MTRLFARCASGAAFLLLQVCGQATAASSPARPAATPPAAGVMLLSLRTGAVVGQVALGEDPLAVALSPDGGTAYVVDNDLGDVFAVRLPSLKVAWRTHVGGQPSGLLVRFPSLFVSQYESSQVAQLDLATGRLLAEKAVAPHPGELAWEDTFITSGDHGFGVAIVGGQVWTAVRLPHLGQRPFWMTEGHPGELLVTTEGAPEDTAPGSVVSIDTKTGKHTVLATPRDPDQAERFNGDLFVAAHGDRDVFVLRDGRPQTWARGAPAVALAPDGSLGLLVVVTDAAE